MHITFNLFLSQTAEILYSTSNLCLSFDASTQEGTHFNVVHVSTASQCFMVDLDELAGIILIQVCPVKMFKYTYISLFLYCVCVCVLLLGGTHEDYCNQICNAFQRAATIHNQIHGIGTIEETHAIMVSNISSSITDRASVNAKTLKVLQQRWGTIITTTYCHLHPLETLSRNALSCLKAFDTVTYDKLYAGTSTADKLLLAIDKWRYSDSSGEPRTFLSFMKSRDISRGTWARTRGNRLHVKLRNAEVCVKYYTELKCYFTHHTTRDSVFKNTILEALSTDVATHQLTALAIFSLILSRPWMKKLYVAHGTDLTHVGAFKKVKTVIDNLKVFTKDQATFTIQDMDSDLFGEKLERNIMGGGALRVATYG